jgi:hypothetical protein
LLAACVDNRKKNPIPAIGDGPKVLGASSIGEKKAV